MDTTENQTSETGNGNQQEQNTSEVMEAPVEAAPNELDMLKQRARLLGITHSGNIGADTLRQKISEHLAGLDNSTTTSSVTEEVNPFQPDAPKKMTLRQKLYMENMKLVRVRIQNLDPKKKDLPGEIFTVANEYIGTVRKFIPYGETTDDGFHMPLVLLKQLKRRKFLNIRTTKGKNGVPQVHQNWAKEFAIEELPPLTQDEIKRLAAAQVAAGILNNDEA